MRQICLDLLLLSGTIIIGRIVLFGPTGAQFRLDTGDLRYTYFGIPGDTHRTSEPERSTIVSLAAGSAVLKPEWVSVPYDRTHGPQWFSQHLFYRAAHWAVVDRQMSKALLEDIARDAKGQRSVQMATILELLIRFEPVGPGVWKPLWPGRDKEVIDYLNSKGLPVPSTRPAATTAPAHSHRKGKRTQSTSTNNTPTSQQ